MRSAIDITIVGAGIIGLAIAAELSDGKRNIYILEKNHTFGLETSSRNSQVIHAGIYYPESSQKAKLCVEGKELLYRLCEDYDIPCKRLGKLVLAVGEMEVGELERLYEQGNRNGVDDLQILSRREFKKLEPNIHGVAALHSPSTGVIDVYSLMRLLHGKAIEKGAHFVFDAEMMGIEKVSNGYKVKVKDREGLSSTTTSILINAAGLGSDRVAKLAGIDIANANYKLHYCKGEYFSVGRVLPVERLIYPMPGTYGVGIHITPNVDGRTRLGPNARYVDHIDYQVEEAQREVFHKSVQTFLPCLDVDDLEPEFAGIRPKLQGPGEGFRDFVIADEKGKGLPGFMNLVGIESPGLTSSIAIAQLIRELVEEYLS